MRLSEVLATLADMRDTRNVKKGQPNSDTCTRPQEPARNRILQIACRSASDTGRGCKERDIRRLLQNTFHRRHKTGVRATNAPLGEDASCCRCITQNHKSCRFPLTLSPCGESNPTDFPQAMNVNVPAECTQVRILVHEAAVVDHCCSHWGCRKEHRMQTIYGYWGTIERAPQE